MAKTKTKRKPKPKKAVKRAIARVQIDVGGVATTISVTDMNRLRTFSTCLRNLFRDLARQGNVAQPMDDPFDRFSRCVRGK